MRYDLMRAQKNDATCFYGTASTTRLKGGLMQASLMKWTKSKGQVNTDVAKRSTNAIRYHAFMTAEISTTFPKYYESLSRTPLKFIIDLFS